MENKIDTEMIFAFVVDPEFGLTLNLSTKEDWDEYGAQSDSIPQDISSRLEAAGYEMAGDGIFIAGDKTIAQMTSEMEALGFVYSPDFCEWLEQLFIDDEDRVRDRDEEEDEEDDCCGGCHCDHD